MDFLVFSAGGRVSHQLCEAVRSDGHSVTVCVPPRARAPPEVSVVEGDLTDTDTVAAAIADRDVVCSTLGMASDTAGTRLTDGLKRIVSTMENTGVDRFVSVAAAGILQATPTRLRLDTVEFPQELEAIASAHKAVYDRLRRSTLDWTMVCPPQMSEGVPTNHYRTTVDYLPDGGQSISTGDVAAFVYQVAVHGHHIGERVGISY